MYVRLKKNVFLQFWFRRNKRMASYLQKAKNDIVVAELLINNGLHKPSAHPAYYSAFLALKYVLAHFYSIDYAQQDVMTSQKDSHKILSNKALPFMVKDDGGTGNDYFVWYNKLQMMRRQADYKPDAIEDSLLKENLNTAKEFMRRINLRFKKV